MNLLRWFSSVTLPTVLLAACSRSPMTMPAAPPAQVEVTQPITKQVTDYEEFTGQIEAVNSTSVRARVTGYLEQVLFKEGSMVKKDDTLFVIDPRIYQAEFDRATANLAQTKAHLGRLQLDYRRAAPLLPTRAISQEDFDKIAGDRDEAAALVKMAEAALKSASDNLNWTKVTALQSGRISRQMIDPGNLVKADDTILTTIVSLDPIYVYFDVDERTMLRIRRLIAEKKVRSARETQVSVLVGLSDEDGFPHVGIVDFVDNQVDKATGTLRLRGKLDNRNGLLSAGMFARVRVPVGDPHDALLVPERALSSDQGNKFVYVVDAKNQVEYRHVDIGSLHDGLRVIEKGLKPDERVIVAGLQRVRPGVTVDPQKTGSAQTATAATAANAPAEKAPATMPVAATKPREKTTPPTVKKL
jgi:RND family efflux transporter MFP subunit